MATLDDVKNNLKKLHELVSGIPELTISKCWNIPNSWATESFPHSSNPGVYFFADSLENILYVGKASSSLGARIGNEYIGRNGVCKSDKAMGATFLYTIPLKHELFFLAPAIEEFLISTLLPPRNSNGLPGNTL